VDRNNNRRNGAGELIMNDENENTGCEGCSMATRRDFLRDAAVIAAGVLASLNARPAAALPTGWVDGMITGANTVSYPVPMTNSVSIDRKNEVVLTRWNGAVYAFALSCPHQKTALRWIEADTRFQCPKHKSKYQPDGTFISGKATRGMDRYSLRRDGSNVIVDMDAMHKQDADPAGWNAAVIKVDGEK
jgi:nitrite reductase/ring-hydroxylating ferredoxin subunit